MAHVSLILPIASGTVPFIDRIGEHRRMLGEAGHLVEVLVVADPRLAADLVGLEGSWNLLVADEPGLAASAVAGLRVQAQLLGAGREHHGRACGEDALGRHRQDACRRNPRSPRLASCHAALGTPARPAPRRSGPAPRGMPPGSCPTRLGRL